jgi:hypothetical protein
MGLGEILFPKISSSFYGGSKNPPYNDDTGERGISPHTPYSLLFSLHELKLMHIG